jgi:tol-pal system protein YbgF
MSRGLALGLAIGLGACSSALPERLARQEAALADFQTAVEGLRADVQRLGGQVADLDSALQAELRRAAIAQETEAGQAQKAQAALTERLATAERRVEELAEGVASLAEQVARLEAGASAVTLSRARAGGGRQPGPTISAEELFDRGMESFRTGELGQAVLDFEEFADRYATHPLVPSAQFWIGEAYFRSRDFEQAAAKYQRAIDLAPSGERTPDALLRLGLAFRSLHREDRAREVWARLVRDFPDSDAALRARAVIQQPGRTVRPAEPR